MTSSEPTAETTAEPTSEPTGDPTAEPARTDFPLAGFRVGVTSHRRAQDLIDALERRGAEVLHAPALKIDAVDQDIALLEATRAIVDARPEVLVVTTAYGMRRWCEAADAAGIGEELLQVLAACRIFVRGPKARGAVRAAGLNDVGISADETTAALVDMLIAEEGVRGKTVVVQLHGYADVVQLDRLREAGAQTVLTVTPYRWVRPDGPDPLPRLIEAVCHRELDVVTFTSAPAVDALWSTAQEMGLYRELVSSFAADVAAAAVGPVTAKPLLEAGVAPLVPERYRMGALIRLVCEYLASNRVQSLNTRAGKAELRGRQLYLNDVAVELAPAPMLLLRTLLGAGGSVVSRAELGSLLDLGPAEHALDMTVSRLRAALPDPSLVETVVKRGYRLSV